VSGVKRYFDDERFALIWHTNGAKTFRIPGLEKIEIHFGGKKTYNKIDIV
jgi:hypothetical protein